MPSVVVYNDEGKVLYQNIFADAQELVFSVREEEVVPGFPQPTSAVRVNSLLVLANQEPEIEREVPKLTAKQCQVLQCLSSSLTPGQTARKMNLSEESIRSYLKILKRKFKTESRDQLMAMAGALGICDPFKKIVP